MKLQIRSQSECRYDEVSLGEVMLRLDPGDTRVRCARSFRVWEGGGEYNVARGLRRCFGMRTGVVTALAQNDVGYLIEDMILQGGVDAEWIQWTPFDGIGRKTRNGLNFTERGFGLRGALGISDRANTAASQMKPGDVDWDELFGRQGARWFHTGGIFAALSETTAEVTIEAVRAAKKYGTIVSYDLQLSPVALARHRRPGRRREVNREIAPYIDVMIGNEEDFTACPALRCRAAILGLKHLDPEGYRQMMQEVAAVYPRLSVTPPRCAVKTATVNDWSAARCADGVVKARDYPALEIYDRVGGGDSFASGLIYGLMTGGDLQRAVDCGAAHGALAMTTPGDTSMARREEVEKLMTGGSARVQR